MQLNAFCVVFFLLKKMNTTKYLLFFLLMSCKVVKFTAYNTVIYHSDSTIIQNVKYNFKKKYKYFNSIQEINKYCNQHTFKVQSSNLFYSYTLTTNYGSKTKIIK